MTKKIFLMCLWVMTGVFCRNGSAFVVINEFLADPPSGLAGDANQDGIRSSSNDEFVELFNSGETNANLLLWSLWDSAALRHQFQAPILLGPKERLVVFGGGDLSGLEGLVFAATSGSLNLNNLGDEIILKDALGNTVSQVLYGNEGNRDQSLTRFPEGNGSFQLHASVSSQGLLFSPGTDAEGNRQENTPVVPEKSSLALLNLVLSALGLMKWVSARSVSDKKIVSRWD